MRDTEKFKGLGVAVITPFLQNGEIDIPSLESLINNLIDKKVDYLVMLGTTAESPTLSDEEKDCIVRTAVRTNRGRVPIVVGIGGSHTREIIEKVKTFNLDGVDAILSVTPFYNKPSQEGLIQHFTEIAYHSPLPIIMYSIMGRTGCNLEVNTVLQLTENERIIGIKEASGNMNQIMSLIKHTPKDFVVISGDDAITLPLLAAGADGLISVVANAFPEKISEMVHLAIQNRFCEARTIHTDMLDLTQACFKEGNPSGIKTVLAIQGKIEYYLRLPLTRVSLEHQSYLKQILSDL